MVLVECATDHSGSVAGLGQGDVAGHVWNELVQQIAQRQDCVLANHNLGANDKEREKVPHTALVNHQEN